MKVLIKNHSGLSGYQRKLKRDSLFLLKSFNLLRAELSILLVNDEEMESLNNRFRGKNKTTDVLSFPLYNSLREIPKEGEAPIGDIVINLKAANRQAQEYGITIYEEIRRLLIHGFLHLLGYDHGRNRYQDRKMRNKEEELNNAIKEMAEECQSCH